MGQAQGGDTEDIVVLPVSKHVTIMAKLMWLVEVCNLMDVSAFEQDLACLDNRASYLCELMPKLDVCTILNV